MDTTTAPRHTVSRQQWMLFVLLLISVALAYIDRGNLSIAAPMLQKEMGISKSQLGFVLSCFFWTYAISLFFAGWVVDRFNVVRVYAAGYFLWSLATGLTGFVNSFALLVAFRFLLGVGESVAYPAVSKIVVSVFPETRRGLANALIDACTKTGPAVGMVFGGLLMARYGWRPFFIVLGLGSLLWIVPWMLLSPPPSRSEVVKPDAGPSVREILSHRAAWGSFGGLFCGNYAWYFLLTWLPSFLVEDRGFTKEEMATLGSIPFFTLAASATFFGWLSDRLIQKGKSPSTVRQSFAVIGLCSSTLMLGSAFTTSHTTALALLIGGCFFFGIYTSNLWAITQRLAGPEAAGKWTGLQNGIGNFGGVVSPWLTGVLVEKTGNYIWPFLITGLFLVLAAIMFGVVIPRVDPVQWKKREAEEPSLTAASAPLPLGR